MLRIFILFTLFFLYPLSTMAETPEEKGLAIAVEDDKRDNGFDDFTANMVMILKNRQGEESTRDIRNKTLEVDGDGDKSLVIFDKPRDVKGTALLNFTHKTGSDDQWLFLPALKRVKRISSSNKSGSFMGSAVDVASAVTPRCPVSFMVSAVVPILPSGCSRFTCSLPSGGRS